MAPEGRKAGDGASVEVKGVVDTGATRTVVTKKLFEKLGGDGVTSPGPLMRTGDGGEHSSEVARIVVEICNKRVAGEIIVANWLDIGFEMIVGMDVLSVLGPEIIGRMMGNAVEQGEQVVGFVVPLIQPPVTHDDVEDEEKEEPVFAQLSPAEREQLDDLLEEFEDIWTKPDGPPPERIAGEVCRIRLLNDQKPIYRRGAPMGIEIQNEVKKLFKELVKKGIAEPSNSSWGAPMLVVRKKSGALRSTQLPHRIIIPSRRSQSCCTSKR